MRAPAVVLVAAFLACGPAGREGPSNVVVGLVGDAGGARPPPPDESRPGDESEPSAVELALSESRACVRTEGRVHCTSDMHEGRAIAAEPPLPGIEDAISLSLGEGFGCVATRAGKVLCFGDNSWGQLGAALRAERSDAPVAVSGVTSAARVFAGPSHACALLRDGGVQCWGRNQAGQTGGRTSYLPPARELVVAETVPGVSGATSVTLGTATTCATTRGRGTWCFGDLPLANPDPGAFVRRAPTTPREEARLAGFAEMTSAHAGGFCGIRNHDVYCWGDTYSILPPDRATGADALRAAGVKGARHVRGGSAHVCAVLEGGDVMCWGSAYSSVLGRKAALPASTVREAGVVAGLAPAVDLAVGGTTSCALASRRATTAQCWGRFPHDVSSSGVTRAGQETSEPVTIRLTE